MWASILDASVLIGVSFLRFFGVCAYVLFGFCGEGQGGRGDGICVLMWRIIGWARFMEWKYPDVEIVITSQKAFKGAGAVEAAASL